MKIANVALDGGKKFGPRLCDWLKRIRPDIVTLQKTGPEGESPYKVTL